MRELITPFFVAARAGTTADGRQYLTEKRLRKLAEYDVNQSPAAVYDRHPSPFDALLGVERQSFGLIHDVQLTSDDKGLALSIRVKPDKALAQKLQGSKTAYPSIEVNTRYQGKEDNPYLSGVIFTPSPAVIGTERVMFSRSLGEIADTQMIVLANDVRDKLQQGLHSDATDEQQKMFSAMRTFFQNHNPFSQQETEMTQDEIKACAVQAAKEAIAQHFADEQKTKEPGTESQTENNAVSAQDFANLRKEMTEGFAKVGEQITALAQEAPVKTEAEPITETDKHKGA